MLTPKPRRLNAVIMAMVDLAQTKRVTTGGYDNECVKMSDLKERLPTIFLASEICGIYEPR